MSSLGTKNKTTTQAQTVSTPTPAPWLASGYESLAGRANSLLDMNPASFTTPATSNQTQAFARAGAGTGDPTATGVAATNGLLNYTPQQVSAAGARTITGPNSADYNASTYDPSLMAGVNPIVAGQLRDTDLAPYYDPYQQNVIDTTMADAAEGNARSLNQLRSSTPTGAFNGSRAGVAEGVVTGENNRNLASLIASLRSTGFDKARGAASTDISNRLGADTQTASNLLTTQGANQNATNNAGATNAAALNAMKSLLAGDKMQTQLANQSGEQFADSASLQAQLANASAAERAVGINRDTAAQSANLSLLGAGNTRADTAQQLEAGGAERDINASQNPSNNILQMLQAVMGLYGGIPAGAFTGQTGSSSGKTTEETSPGLLDIMGTIMKMIPVPGKVG